MSARKAVGINAKFKRVNSIAAIKTNVPYIWVANVAGKPHRNTARTNFGPFSNWIRLGSHFLKININSAMGLSSGLTDVMYTQVFYTYKYSAIKIFFRTNYANFLPPYDVRQIEDGGKKQIFKG